MMDSTGLDPTLVWDSYSLAVGINAIDQWRSDTSFSEKVLDVVGVVLDTAALATPMIPGGFGAGLKILRNSNNSSRGEKILQEAKEITIRMTRKDGLGVRITKKDGSVIDITRKRVKEFIPNIDPRAPEGTMQRVKFKEFQPGSKGLKRDPKIEDLNLLNDAIKREK